MNTRDNLEPLVFSFLCVEFFRWSVYHLHYGLMYCINILALLCLLFFSLVLLSSNIVPTRFNSSQNLMRLLKNMNLLTLTMSLILKVLLASRTILMNLNRRVEKKWMMMMRRRRMKKGRMI